MEGLTERHSYFLADLNPTEPGDRSVIWGSAHSDDVEHCSPSPRACIDPETERLQDYLTASFRGAIPAW